VAGPAAEVAAEAVAPHSVKGEAKVHAGVGRVLGYPGMASSAALALGLAGVEEGGLVLGTAPCLRHKGSGVGEGG